MQITDKWRLQHVSAFAVRSLSEDINDCAVVGAADELKGQVGEADFSCGSWTSFVF